MRYAIALRNHTFHRTKGMVWEDKRYGFATPNHTYHNTLIQRELWICTKSVAENDISLHYFLIVRTFQRQLHMEEAIVLPQVDLGVFYLYKSEIVPYRIGKFKTYIRTQTSTLGRWGGHKCPHAI